MAKSYPCLCRGVNMKKPKQIMETIFAWLLIVFCILALVAFLGLEIYLWVEYGGKPLGEIPTWALYLMWGKK